MSTTLGLTTEAAQNALKQYGKNVIKPKRATPLIVQFLRQFADVLVVILIAAAGVAYYVGEQVDAIIIAAIVVINALIGFFQEYKAERAIEALRSMLQPKARVIRDNEERSIDASRLVPGDVIILSEGDKVPADCVLLNASELTINESILTGESVPVNKHMTIETENAQMQPKESEYDAFHESKLTDKSGLSDRASAHNLSSENRIFMGTEVSHGTAMAQVISTGLSTEFGKIAQLTTSTKKDLSPLQKELKHIGGLVGKITLVIAVLLFIVGYLIQNRPLVDTILFAISVAVAAVPEGLPTTITVALALGVQRMAKKNAIIKQLSSVETLGSTTVICSDKTGTLTKNEMTVQQLFFDDHTVTVTGVGYEPSGELSAVKSTMPQNAPTLFVSFTKDTLHLVAYKNPNLYEHLELLTRAAVVCNNARLTFVASPIALPKAQKVSFKDKFSQSVSSLSTKAEGETIYSSADEEHATASLSGEGTWKILGDPTEGALLTAAEKAGFLSADIHVRHRRIFELPFDSQTKRMVVCNEDTQTHELYTYMKGAPDSIVTLCTHTIENGHVVEMTDEMRKNLLLKVDEMAYNALRTIAVAYKKIDRNDIGENPETHKRQYTRKELESNLIFLGLYGMIDPPREEVKEAVKLTHKAGIRTFIVTGDHGTTAHAIARQLGIARPFGVNIITGEMLNAMGDEKLLSLLAPGQETIFARVTPEHKLRIVNTLKNAGEVVAVTGDGVNDAPALKRADIGIAMGISGTDVSKEAANMVLTDDSFGSIVNAIIEGRTIYENMKKFTYFIFSSNIGELLALLTTMFLGLPAPLTAVLILLINTLTDVFPSLALGLEPVEQSILENPPRKTNERIMNKNFIIRYCVTGVYIGLATAGTFIWNLMQHGWHFGERLSTDSSLYIESASIAFVTLTFMQMVHVFNSRSATESVFKMDFFSNIALLFAVLSSTVLTILFVEVPFFQQYLGTSSLTAADYAVIILVSLTILGVEEVRKIISRKRALRSHHAA